MTYAADVESGIVVHKHKNVFEVFVDFCHTSENSGEFFVSLECIPWKERSARYTDGSGQVLQDM